MNKIKLALSVTGGVAGLAVLVAAFFAWSAFSSKTAAMDGDEEEGVDGLETVLSHAQTYSRKPIYPCAASVKALESNRVTLVEWQGEARKLAIRGDRVYAKTTPAAFKTFIVADAKRLAALPGGVGGALVKPGFAFGPFKDYIAEGKMPADTELAIFQRRWDDVATVAEILSACGVAELTDVQFKEAAADKAEEEAANQKAKGKGRKNQRSRTKKKAAPDPSALGPRDYSYTFSFEAKPIALVKALNAFVVSERFITIDAFTFARAKDGIGEILGGAEKKGAAAPAATGRRGRRGRRAAQEVQKQAAAESDKEAEKKNRALTDPLTDAPLSVVMTVTVSDFRSLEDVKDEEAKK